MERVHQALTSVYNFKKQPVAVKQLATFAIVTALLHLLWYTIATSQANGGYFFKTICLKKWEVTGPEKVRRRKYIKDKEQREAEFKKS